MEGTVNIDYGLFAFNVSFHAFSDVLCRCGIVRHHDCERFADVVDPVARKDRMLDRHVIRAMKQRADRLDALEVIQRKNQRAVRLRDGLDPAAGDRAPHEAHRRGAARRVRGEAPAPEEQRRILDAP
jgi:hypothetical protein